MIPWRPAADPTCAGGTAWRAGDGLCYNGFAFAIAFDLRSLNYDLPEQFIYGIAYNTNTWGYAPIGAPGPYESLNVGLNSTPPVAVGTDVDPDAVYINYQLAAFYTDAGAGGVGTLRPDTGWAPYTPAVQFTTFAVPTTTAGCKNGAWRNLVRSDFTSFTTRATACNTSTWADSRVSRFEQHPPTVVLPVPTLWPLIGRSPAAICLSRIAAAIPLT